MRAVTRYYPFHENAFSYDNVFECRKAEIKFLNWLENHVKTPLKVFTPEGKDVTADFLEDYEYNYLPVDKEYIFDIFMPEGLRFLQSLVNDGLYDSSRYDEVRETFENLSPEFLYRVKIKFEQCYEYDAIYIKDIEVKQ